MSRSSSRSACAAAVLALALAGCASAGPDYAPPKPEAPAHWQGAAAPGTRNAALLAQWWRQFHDPVLNGLIHDALAANTDLRTARAKLREARARRDLARAGLGPTSSASVTANRSASSAEVGSGATSNLYNAKFDASWEPDVFGAARRGLEAAQADLEASGESLRDTRVSLIAEVARNYVELRTAEQRLATAEDNLATQAELYDLTRWRREAGLVSELDEAQARTLLEQTRAGLPTLRTTVSDARNRLAILVGRPPGALDPRLRSGGAIPAATDRIAAGVPADTLRQRPDVRVAERRLAAQTARLGEAEAARYPSFRLSGSLGVEALTVDSLSGGNAGTTSLLAGITAPIFDAGRIRSNIAVQDALLEQARLAYRAAVLTAVGDVEDALTALAHTRQRQDELGRAVASARQAREIAQHQYAAGLTDFQTVLDSQRTLLNLEDQLASAAGDHSSAQIRLYKALGGGWTPEAEPVKAKESS